MRAKFVLVVGLALLPGACSARVDHSPPPLNKQLLTGKWKSNSDTQLFAGYEFAEDGTLKMIVQGMKQPVQGRYTWSDERTLTLEYETPPEVQQAYRVAAKAYKDDVTERIQTGKLPDRAGPSILGTVQDELPASETVRVGLSEQPRLLMLGSDSGISRSFEKAD